MSFPELSYIAGAFLLSFGGGAAIVFVLSRWLGGVWAKRIIATEEAQEARAQELLIRRRDVYSKIAVSMRVFLTSSTRSDKQQQQAFLAAYDEAALWAPDSVMNPIGGLLDQIKENAQTRGKHSEETLQASYAACLSAMRRDCGHPETKFRYRVVAF